MIEDFFLLFFGHNLNFFWLYRQIKSALNFKSYNFITCMQSHRSTGSFATDFFFATFLVDLWGILSSKSLGRFQTDGQAFTSSYTLYADKANLFVLLNR